MTISKRGLIVILIVLACMELGAQAVITRLDRLVFGIGTTTDPMILAGPVPATIRVKDATGFDDGGGMFGFLLLKDFICGGNATFYPTVNGDCPVSGTYMLTPTGTLAVKMSSWGDWALGQQNDRATFGRGTRYPVGYDLHTTSQGGLLMNWNGALVISDDEGVQNFWTDGNGAHSRSGFTGCLSGQVVTDGVVKNTSC